MVEFTVYKGSESGAIVKSTSTRQLGANEVLVKVTHSGLCGTDEHYKHQDMVLGHEGVGIVENIGSSVKDFKRGQKVGWGYQHASCGSCKQCLTGHETLCPARQMYGSADLDQGSFSSYAIWRADFLFHIPEAIANEYAAPLMCGGATVFAALRNHGAKSGDKVGVIGVGGLGHLAIQFAAKMGCEVIVFSGTDSKKEESLKLGATSFIATKQEGWEENLGPVIDHLLVTASFSPDWKQYGKVMAPGGTIYPLTVDHGDFKIPQMLLIAQELKVQGSVVASRQVMRDMLSFSALHGIKSIIEQFPMSENGITEAMTKLREGRMRYRGVLVAQ
ncbi:putative NADP-dependent alcohol dehydrogenase C 2 [Bisporella sp. PMI_857]|nr:putative NADP-dependent alcohol dehydrogenase C 2 [Bisporella sp. PMI_857]